MATIGYNPGDDCDRARLWGWVREPDSKHWRLVCYGEVRNSLWQWLSREYPVLQEIEGTALTKPDKFPTETCGTSLVVLLAHRHPGGGEA